MNLSFITHKQDILNDLGKKRTVHQYAIINNKLEAKSYEEQGFTALSNRAFQMAELLQLNKDFIRFIDEFKSMRIGLIKTEIPEFSLKNFDTSPPEEIIQQLETSRRTQRARKALKANYNVDDEVSNQIPFIIHFNCIFLPIIKPEILILKHEDKSICIQISADITINQLLEYIATDKHKEIFNKEVSTLTRKNFFIADRDTFIFTKREEKINGSKKLSFGKISEQVVDTFGLGGINEPNTTASTIKTAFYRTEERIHSVFHKKKH